MSLHPKIRVSVMHGDPVIAAGLIAVLTDQVGVEVGHRVSQARQQSGDLPDVDVLVTDYSNGIDAVASLKAQSSAYGASGARVLIVTDIDREWEVRFAISAGIRGYLLQGCPIGELIDGVRNVSQGQRCLSHSVARRIADSMSREELTTRETEVLQLLTTGCCNKSIARDLGIAVGTVKVHVKGILEKLNAASRTHAVIVAAERGLINRTASIDRIAESVNLHALSAGQGRSRNAYEAHP